MAAQRRMSYRIPETKYKEVKEKLADKGINFNEFLDRTIDLYLDGKIDPKNQTDGWGKWMEK